MSSYGDEYFRAEKVRIINNISDPDYFRVEKVRIIDNINDPDYFRADKVRIIEISDPDYFHVKKVRNISNISDPDYFRAKKVRVVKLLTYSTQPSITKSKYQSSGIGGFCLVVIAALIVGGLIWGLAGLISQSGSATSNYTYDMTYPVSKANLSGSVIKTPAGATDASGNPWTPGINLSFGGSATFQVNVPNAGAYFLRIIAANGMGGDSVQVSINNGAPMSVVIGDGAESQSGPESANDVAIQFHAGDNTIVLSNQSPQDGSADFCANNMFNCGFIASIEVLKGS